MYVVLFFRCMWCCFLYVSGVVLYKLYRLPYYSRYWDLPLQGKIFTAEPGIEPGTSWLVFRSSDYKATRPVLCIALCSCVLLRFGAIWCVFIGVCLLYGYRT
jgi:hypothetical protein